MPRMMNDSPAQAADSRAATPPARKRQAPLERRVRRRRDPGLIEDPKAVELAALSASGFASSCADPRCPISRDPAARTTHDLDRRRPDLVFTVRTHGISPPHGPPLVRKPASGNP